MYRGYSKVAKHFKMMSRNREIQPRPSENIREKVVYEVVQVPEEENDRDTVSSKSSKVKRSVITAQLDPGCSQNRSKIV